MDSARRAGGPLALLLALLAALAGCGPQAPSVLVVSIDTLRADAAAAHMPRLAALADGGTRYSRATATTPLTLPSHMSLLTGLTPTRHGLTVNGLAVPSLPVSTLAEELAASGRTTGAFVSAAVLDRRHGLDRGFDHYDDELHVAEGPARPHERRGDHTVDRALAWIGEQAGPWLAFVHLYDPHAPYAAPGGRRAPRQAAYDDEVAFADAQLGRLLDGLPDDVLVVVTSDHGEGLGEHGEQTHGMLLHEATLHVPLVLAWWGNDQRARPGGQALREDLVSLLDVTPTVLELLGLPDDGPARDGRSVVAPGAPRAVPLEGWASWFYYGFSPLAGVRLGDRKLVGAPRAEPPRWELVELDDDPHELAPVDGSGDRLRPQAPTMEPPGQASAAVDEASLRALGYLAPSLTGAPDGSRADPRDALPLIDAIDAANTALATNDPAAALRALTPFVTDWADVSELQLYLGKTQRALGRGDLAERALRRAVGLQPDSVGTLRELAKVLMERASEGHGDPQEALVILERAEALVPGDLETTALRALHDVIFGDPAQALRRLEPALRRWPLSQPLRTVEQRARQALEAVGG